MSIVDKVREAIQFDISEDDSEKVPLGWRQLYIDFREAVKLLNGRITRVRYTKGVLQVEVESIDGIHSDALKWLTQGLAKQSARKCMIDPDKKGFRRKLYDNWPVLSELLFVEYANLIEEDTE